MLRTIASDFAAFAANRFEPLSGRSLPRQLWICWRTLWQSEAMWSVLRYRLAVSLRRRHVPLIPWVLRTWNIRACGLSIGPHVDLGDGVYFPHGQVVIDGIVGIGRNCVIAPWVTIGLSTKRDDHGNAIVVGPTIGDWVAVGTGAKLLGPIKIGAGARIGANAVVLTDVPAGATAVGVPARVLEAPALASAIDEGTV